MDRYARDGFLVARAVLPASDVQELGRQARKLLADESALERSDRFVLGRLPGRLAALHENARLLAMASQLLGEDLALYLSRLLVKDTTWNGEVAAHQDMPYFHGGERKLSVFVPLGPVGPRSGGLRLLAGSHRYGNVGIRGTLQVEEFPDLRDELPVLSEGDLLLVDFLTWHYSEQNRSQRDRLLVQLVYQPATDGSYDGRYQAAPVLAQGAWRTDAFLSYGMGIVPDAAAAPAPPAPSAFPRWWRRWRAG